MNYPKVALSAFLSIMVMILFIWLLSSRLDSNEEIYEDRKNLFVFIIIYILTIIVALILTYCLSINDSNINTRDMIIILITQLLLNFLLFICYCFNIKLGSFNWNVSLSSMISVFIIFLVGRPLFFFVTNGTTNITQILTPEFYLKTIYAIYYPVIFEETLYRGFLISGLKSLKLTDLKCNIIQAIFFGIMHVFQYRNPSINMLLTTCIQTALGYVFGKLYFKTKSLAPGILLHALWNTYLL